MSQKEYETHLLQNLNKFREVSNLVLILLGMQHSGPTLHINMKFH